MHVILTGTSRGIGLALAREFLKAGIDLSCCSRAPGQDPAFHDLLVSHDYWSAVDLRKAEEVEAWAQSRIEKFGAPHLLINNAALINPVLPLWEIDQEDFSELIDVNIKAVAHCCQLFIPEMINEGRGVVVNFSSGWGTSTSPGVAPYCASKYAIEGLTKALAQELPYPLCAVALSPGTVYTEMLTTAFGENQASQSVSPNEWAQRNLKVLLDIDRSQNGETLVLSL